MRINTSHITSIYIGADGCTLKADFENGKGCQIARYDVDRFSKIALNFIGIVVRNKVFRCKSCGKIYPEYVPDVCRRCGKELTEEMNPEEARILRPQYTDLVEKVVAKKGLLGWRVLRTDDTERSAD